MIVLKLGGSVITDKETPETLDEAALDRVSTTVTAGVADSDEQLVLVHGGGSFGHHHAATYGVDRTIGTTDTRAITAIHESMRQLNSAVIDRLVRRGLPAVPIAPLSVGWRDRDGTLQFPMGSLRALLDNGFVPVAHGDVVAHVGEGATILSGDELVVAIATALDAERIGVCSTVPGVLEDGTVVDRITSYEQVDTVLGESESTDVTGGMAAKVRSLLDLDASASIFGASDLEAFFDGEPVGTTVEAN